MSPTERLAHRRKVSSLFDRLGPPPLGAPSFRPPTFDGEAFEVLQRAFARYARSVNGVVLGNDKLDRVYHFDDSVRYSAPHWPPSLVYNLLEFHSNQATRKGKLTPADIDIPAKLLATLQTAYNRARGRQLPAESYRAGQMFVKKWRRLCSPDRLELDTTSLLALTAAIFNPAYRATFRQRFDVALYTALSCATGLGSTSFLNMPGSGFDGVRWRDFALWMTKDGPQAFLFSPSFRPYRLKDGPCLALSAAKLIAIGMLLDGVIAGDVALEQLSHPQFWGGGDNERQVLQDFERSKLHVFRNQVDHPIVRADMNKEYARLSRVAHLDAVVTTGCFRRLVARQVFNQYGLEITSAVLGHRAMAETKKFLERRMICISDTTISGSISPRDVVTWATLYPYMKVFTLQNMTNYVDPRSWRDRNGRLSPLPEPAPTADPVLAALAGWMLGPPEFYTASLGLASMLNMTQFEFAQRREYMWGHDDEDTLSDMFDMLDPSDLEDFADCPDSDDDD